MEAKISASPPAPIYLERGHAVVGGHLFSPFPQKRVLGDSLMQESSILLPCDRDAQIGSPAIRKVKDVESNPTLTSSYGESDSVISSCMLTSESFYGQTESSLLRSDNEFYSVDNVKISREVLSHAKPDKTPVNESPPSKSRKRNVNWGDRKSIRLSIEYPKSMAADFNPKTLEKVNNSSYFRICFGTEFSDEDDEDALFTSGGQSMTGESDSTLDVHEKDFGNSIIPSSSNTKAKKPLVRVSFLSATTSELLGVIETEDGMLSPQSLAKFSLPQIQLIINDLLDQISQKNEELMHELPKRDDLILEKEEKQAYLDRVAMKQNAIPDNFILERLGDEGAQSDSEDQILGTRCIGNTSNKRSYAPTIRPSNLNFTDAFNPNPEYRYPFNSPLPRMSPDNPNDTCQTVTPKLPEAATTPTVGSRLKTCINKFFSSRRSRQPTSPNSSNLKSMSF